MGKHFGIKSSGKIDESFSFLKSDILFFATKVKPAEYCASKIDIFQGLPEESGLYKSNSHPKILVQVQEGCGARGGSMDMTKIPKLGEYFQSICLAFEQSYRVSQKKC